MYNDDLSRENIQLEIDRYTDKITKLTALLDQIKTLKFYECGIRKTDHRICFFDFSLTGTDAVVTVKIPKTSESYQTNIACFISDYVPYSEKTRAILPKRSKK